jgi:hypothetical protein
LNRIEMESQCCFDLHFPLWPVMLNISSCVLLDIWTHPLKKLCSVHLPISALGLIFCEFPLYSGY